jgi:hypothetical protein
LLTARIAVEDLSRDVGCVPGPVESALSEGCHRAIREGWARLVTGADDVCEMIADARSLAMGAVEVARRERPPRKKPAVDAKSDAPRAVSDDARAVLTEVRNQRRAGLDELERALGWPIPRLACATLELEVAGAVERDAQIRTMRFHRFLQGAGAGRAHTVIDIESIGIIADGDQLNASDQVLGRKRFVYPQGSQRALKNGDHLSLSQDRRTLKLDWQATADGVNQIRVIVDVSDPQTVR